MIKTVEKEVDGLDRLAEKITEAQEKGETERAERRQKQWDAHYEKGLKHIEGVAASVAKHLQRDARAAANHIAKGLALSSKDDAEFAKQVDEASGKVSKSIAKILEDGGIVVEA